MMEMSSRKDTREVEHGTGDISLTTEVEPEGSDTLESFLSKVTFESDFRKKTF